MGLWGKERSAPTEEARTPGNGFTFHNVWIAAAGADDGVVAALFSEVLVGNRSDAAHI